MAELTGKADQPDDERRKETAEKDERQRREDQRRESQIRLEASLREWDERRARREQQEQRERQDLRERMEKERQERMEKERREQRQKWEEQQRQLEERRQKRLEEERQNQLEEDLRERLLAQLPAQQQEQWFARLLEYQNELSTPRLAREQDEWTKSEDSILLMQYRKGLGIDDLAKRHLRSPGQIRLRLVQLNGMDKFYSVTSKKDLAVYNGAYINPFDNDNLEIVTHFVDDMVYYWTPSRANNPLPYDVLIYDDPDTIMIRDGFRQPQVYLKNKLIPEDHFNNFVGFLRNYIGGLFTRNEVITLKSYLENNGYHDVQIEEKIVAPVSKSYALINEDLLLSQIQIFYETEIYLYCDSELYLPFQYSEYYGRNSCITLSYSNIKVIGTYLFFENDALEFSEEYVEKCVEEVDWMSISKHVLSEGFIRKYADRVDWKAISSQSLSESFIEEFSDRIDWYSLRSPVNVVEKFIESLDMIGLSQVDWRAINKLNLSDRFRAEFHNRLKYYFPASARYHPSYESYEDWQEPDYEYEALKEELMDDIEADREDHARSDEEGWYYDG